MSNYAVGTQTPNISEPIRASLGLKCPLEQCPYWNSHDEVGMK